MDDGTPDDPAHGVVVAAIVMTWALQPASLTTMPVVLALLGVRREVDEDVSNDSSGIGRFVMSGAVALGLVASLGVGAVDFMFNRAVQADDGAAALSLEKLYLGDPVVSYAVAQSLSFQVTDEASLERMLDAFERIDGDRTDSAVLVGPACSPSGIGR